MLGTVGIMQSLVSKLAQKESELIQPDFVYPIWSPFWSLYNDDTDFGTPVVGTAILKTFTIRNSGSSTLTLSIPITVAGSSDFAVTTQPSLTDIPVGGSTTFEVAFTPIATGPVTATIAIGNDDGDDENPYNFAVQGEGAVDVATTATAHALATEAAVTAIAYSDTCANWYNYCHTCAD